MPPAETPGCREGLNNAIEGTANAAHCEGNSNSISGGAAASHCEGEFNQTHNRGEYAGGRYNLSHTTGQTYSANNTEHSVGVGSSSGRKNAFEIMQDGKVYVYGIGGYDGTNPSEATDLATFVGNLQATLSMAANGGIGGADGRRYVLAVDAGGHLCVVKIDEEDRDTPNLTNIQFAAIPEDAADSTDSAN